MGGWLYKLSAFLVLVTLSAGYAELQDFNSDKELKKLQQDLEDVESSDDARFTKFGQIIAASAGTSILSLVLGALGKHSSALDKFDTDTRDIEKRDRERETQWRAQQELLPDVRAIQELINRTRKVAVSKAEEVEGNERHLVALLQLERGVRGEFRDPHLQDEWNHYIRPYEELLEMLKPIESRISGLQEKARNAGIHFPSNLPSLSDLPLGITPTRINDRLDSHHGRFCQTLLEQIGSPHEASQGRIRIRPSTWQYLLHPAHNWPTYFAGIVGTVAGYQAFNASKNYDTAKQRLKEAYAKDYDVRKQKWDAQIAQRQNIEDEKKNIQSLVKRDGPKHWRGFYALVRNVLSDNEKAIVEQLKSEMPNRRENLDNLAKFQAMLHKTSDGSLIDQRLVDAFGDSFGLVVKNRRFNFLSIPKIQAFLAQQKEWSKQSHESKKNAFPLGRAGEYKMFLREFYSQFFDSGIFYEIAPNGYGSVATGPILNQLVDETFRRTYSIDINPLPLSPLAGPALAPPNPMAIRVPSPPIPGGLSP